MNGQDWSVADLDRERRQRFARLSAEERLEISEELLELAVPTGALARLRARRQREVDRLWGQTGTATSG